MVRTSAKLRFGQTGCLLALLAFTSTAHAIRPFITDDARVVGEHTAQLETWLVFDDPVIEHNVFGAFGPTDWLELTLGVTQGGAHSGPEKGYAITGPVVQGKALLLEARNNGRPGLAIAAGVLPPSGYGSFTPPGWAGFAYLAATESLLDERVLIHANVGVSSGDEADSVADLGFAGPPPAEGIRTLITAGIGTQVKIVGGLHGVAELYFGDPYDPRTDFPAMQVGGRYIVSDHVQMDATFGTTLTGVETPGGHAQTQQWGTLGLRLVTSPLW